MELTSPGPSNEVDVDKSGEGTDAMQSVEVLEGAELVEPGNGQPRTVPSTDQVTDEAVGSFEELAAEPEIDPSEEAEIDPSEEPEIDPSEAEPEEDLVEEAELEPEPRKAHSEDLDSDERLSPEPACATPTTPVSHPASLRASQDALTPPSSLSSLPFQQSTKSYDYLLKVLLVGDSDVGKQEILAGLDDGNTEWGSSYATSAAGGAAFKETIILIDGKRVKLQLWDTSGQGRFCTIIRSYSRGAQGILLVYDITNKWSFEGIDRWRKEVNQHAPGIPKVLVGNRLHLAFRRQVAPAEAEEYAEKNAMGFFEVSPLVNFNISESFVELARMALTRNGMERLWRSNRVSTLYECCAHAIVNRTTVYGIDRLPLPDSVKQNLKSYAMSNASTLQGQAAQFHGGGTSIMGSARKKKKHSLRYKKTRLPPSTPADAAAAASARCGVSRKSCSIS